MSNTAKSRKPLIIGIIAAVVILAALLTVLLTHCVGGSEEATAPATEPSATEVPTYQLYWNVDRAEYDGKSEAGMSSRMPESDGYFHVRVVLDGEMLTVKVVDRKIINQMDVNDLFQLVFDDNGFVTGILTLDELPLEKAAWKFYVQSAGSTLVKTNSSETLGGMEYELRVTDATGIYDMSGKSGPVGCEATPIPYDRVYAVQNMAGEVTHIFLYERMDYMLTHEGECQHCKKTVTWSEWVRTDSLPIKAGHYQLMNDIQLNGQQSISEQDQKICLDLNGKRVDGKSGSRVYSMHNAGSHLAIMDTSEGQTGVLAAHGTGDQGMVVWIRYGQLHFYGGTMDASDASSKLYGTAVTVPKSTYFYMYGGTIIGGTAKYVYTESTGKYSRGYGGTIQVSGKMVMHDGEIRDGYAQSVTYRSGNSTTTTRGYGGNIFMSGGSVVEINGGTIKGGVAGSNGGNIYMDGACELTLNDGVISGGKITGSGKNGGSIYVSSKAVFTMNGGSVLGGVCYNAGGNLYVNGTFTMNGGVVAGGKCYNYTTKKLNKDSTNYNLFLVSGNFSMYGGRIAGGVGVTDASTTKTTTVVLSGYATIQADSANTTNLTLNSGGDTTVLVGTLYDSAKIGVNTSRGVFTRPTKEANKDNFFSDIKEAEIIYTEKGELALGRMNCICGKTDTHINGCNGDVYLWAPWISATSAPKNEGNYYLIKEVVTTGQTVVAKGETVRLDLNGFDLSYNVSPSYTDGYRVYRSAFESALIITDTTDKPGRIYSEMPSEAEVQEHVKAMLESGDYDQEKADKIVAAQKAGNFGSVLWARGGDIVLHNGILDGSNLNGSKSGMTVYIGANTASEDNGVTRKGSFVMYNGTIKGATSSASGGSLYGAANSSITIHGGVIENGVSTNSQGGNIYAADAFYMDGGIVRNGKAEYSGGNISLDGATVVATITGDAQILNGQAGDREAAKDAGRGGNIRLSGTGAKLTLSGEAVVSGGQVYRSGSSKAGYGGNFSINTGATFTMTGGTIEGGVADYRGGNIDVCGAMILEGGTITGGKSITGGNIYLLNGEGRELTMTGGTIEKGRATAAGGNLYAFAPVTITGGVIAEGVALTESGVPASSNSGGNIVTVTTMKIGGNAIIRDGVAGAYGGNINASNAEGSYADLTVCDNAQILNGTADAKGTTGLDAGTGGNIRLNGKVTFTMKDNALIYGGTVAKGGSGGGHGGNIVMGSATVKMLGGVIEKGTASSGGGNISINATSGSVLMDGVIIRDGKSSSSAGGNIRVLGNGVKSLEITGDTQILNGQASSGGNIYVYPSDHATIIISGNAKIAGGNVPTGNNGGNIFLADKIDLTITDNAVIDGTDSVCKRGGAMYMDSTNANILISGNAKILGSKAGSATNGAALYLRGNTVISENAQIVAGTGATYGNAIYMNNATLTLKDNALVNAEGTTGTYGTAIYSYHADDAVTIQDQAVVKSGSNTESGGIYMNNSGSELNVFGGTIVGAEASSAGAVYSNGEFTMTDGTIYGAKISKSGGAVYTTGEFTMSGGTIVGGEAKYGGSVYAYNGGNFTMTGGTIVGGKAYRGGNVLIEANANAATFTMTGGIISGGAAINNNGNVGQGGNLWLYANKTTPVATAVVSGGSIGGEVTVEGKTYKGGTSTGVAGNIYVAARCQLDVENVTISGGHANTSGGNINNAGTLNMTNATVTGGVAVENGGNIYTSGTLTLNGTDLMGGVAETVSGGNLLVYSGNATMTGGTISGGTNGAKYTSSSAPNGGNVRIGSDGHFTLESGSIVDGKTINTGANLIVYGEFTMNGGTVSGGKKINKSGEVTATNNTSLNVYVVDATMNMNGGAVDGRVALYGKAKLKISGAATMASQDQEAEELYLNGTTEPITITGALTADRVAKVKISGDAQRIFSTAPATEADAARFTAYATDDSVFLNQNQKLEIGKVGCVCGSTDDNHIGDCEGDSLNWSAWTETDSLPTAGNWYLTGDVNITGKYTGRLTKNTNLAIDLNGHDVNYSANNGNRLFTTYNNGYQNDVHVILTDRSEAKDGKIVATNQTMGHNGPVMWLSCARTSLSLYHITIDGTQLRTLHSGETLGSDSGPKNGGVISLTGSTSVLNLFNASILGGTSEHGDAIAVIGENAILRLEGKVNITATEGDAILWQSKQPLDITKLESVESDITIYGEGTFTEGFSGGAVKWFNTLEDRIIQVRSGELHLAQYHCLCDMPNGKHVEGFCDGTKYVWEPWIKAHMPGAGNWYLTGDVTESNDYMILGTDKSTVRVDLNGFNFTSIQNRMYSTYKSKEAPTDYTIDVVMTNTAKDDRSVVTITSSVNQNQGRVAWLRGENKTLKAYNIDFVAAEGATSDSNGFFFSVQPQNGTNKTGNHLELYNVTLTGGNTTGSNSAGALAAGANSEVVLKNVTINNCSGTEGGAIRMVGTSSLIMENVIIDGCEATGRGGALYITGTCQASMKNVTVTNSKGADDTGIYINDKANLTMSGTVVADVYRTANTSLQFSDLASGSAIAISGTEGVLSQQTYAADDADLTYLTAASDSQYLILVDGKLNLKGNSCICGMPEGKHVEGFCDTTMRSWKTWSGSTAPSESGNYILTDDLTIAATTYLNSKDVDIVIDLNGHNIIIPTLTGYSASRMYSTHSDPANSYAVNVAFTNTASGDATIKVEGTGDEARIVWLHGSNKSVSVYNVDIDLTDAETSARKDGIAFDLEGSNNTLTMYDVNITAGNTSTSYGQVLRVDGNNTVELNRCVVDGGSGNNASYGGFAYVRGKMTLNDCELRNLSATANGGVFYIYGTDTVSANLVLNNTLIEDCSSGGPGGAIDLQKYGKAEINSCTIRRCSAVTRAGGVHVYTDCQLVMKNTTIEECSVTGTSRGGGLYNYEAAITLTDCTIRNNSATGTGPLGGGIYLYGTDITMGGKMIITGNTAGGETSNVYLNDEYIIISEENPLKADSLIGVYPYKGETDIISQNAAYSDKKFFFSDLDNLQIVHNGTNLKLELASEHWHCICGGVPTGDPDHKCKDIEFTEISSLTHGQLKSGNYYLKESMTISGVNAVELNGEDITLCLNGSTLTPASGKRAFTLIGEKESKLTVTSCSDGGTIIGGIAEGGAVRVGKNGGELNMYNITLDASKSVLSASSFGSTLYTQDVIKAYNCDMIGSAQATNAGRGGTVTISDPGVMYMYGGFIRGGNTTGDTEKTSSGNAGNVYLSGTLHIYGGTITGGKSTYSKSTDYSAGNIYVGPTGTINMHSGAIENGEAKSSGGNILLHGKLNMYGGTISGGKSSGDASSYRANIRSRNGSQIVMTGGLIDGHLAVSTATTTVKLSGDAKIFDEGAKGLYVIPGNTKLYIGDLSDNARIDMIVVDTSDKYVYTKFAEALDAHTLTAQDAGKIKITTISGAAVNGNVVLNDDNTLSVEPLS